MHKIDFAQLFWTPVPGFSFVFFFNYYADAAMNTQKALPLVMKFW